MGKPYVSPEEHMRLPVNKFKIMRKEKAKNYYLGKSGEGKFNCAQSVMKAYFDLFNIPEREIDACAAFSAGRAPEGRCGAYHAACHLVAKKNPARLASFEREFLSAAGSLECQQIRAKKKLSCLGCVEKAAELLDGGEND